MSGTHELAEESPRAAPEAARAGSAARGRRWLGRLVWVALAPALAWSVAAILLGGGTDGPGWIRGALVLLFAGGAVGSLVRLAPRTARLVLACQCLAVVLWWSTITPASERDWASGFRRPVRAEIDGPVVTLRGMRDFRYDSAGVVEERWTDAVLDLRELEGVDFLLVRFAGFKGVGHTMVSFRFADGRVVTVSVEARREVGETYGVVRGAFRQYELAYVIGDERDLLELRTSLRGDDVYLYPCSGSKEAIRAYFLDVLARANRLAERPEFYDSLTNNCATNLVAHWERVNGRRVPLDHRILLPGYVDGLGMEMGVLEAATDPETRQSNLVTPRAREAAGRADFSALIRR